MSFYRTLLAAIEETTETAGAEILSHCRREEVVESRRLFVLIAKEYGATNDAIANQTAALQNTANQGFNGVQAGIGGLSRQVEAKSAADQLAMCQQTYTLTDGANKNTAAIIAKLDAIEDARKDREINALQNENTTLKSQNFIGAAIAQATAPINAQIAQLIKEVDDIKCKQPNTVSVTYPNLVAVNNTPYGGPYYGNSGWGGIY